MPLQDVYQQNPMDIIAEQNNVRQKYAQGLANLENTGLHNQTLGAQLPGIQADSESRVRDNNLAAALYDETLAAKRQKMQPTLQDFGQASAAWGEMVSRIPPQHRKEATKQFFKEHGFEKYYNDSWGDLDPTKVGEHYKGLGRGIMDTSPALVKQAGVNDAKVEVAQVNATARGRSDQSAERRAQIAANAKLMTARVKTAADGYKKASSAKDPKSLMEAHARFVWLAENESDPNKKAAYAEASRRISIEARELENFKQASKNAGKPDVSGMVPVQPVPSTGAKPANGITTKTGRVFTPVD